MANKTYTTIKNEIRTAAVETLSKALAAAYGEAAITGKVGASEICVCVGIDEETGAKQYVTFAPTVKDFRTYKATKKTFTAYDGEKAVQAFSDKMVEQAEKKAETARKKAEKIAKDNEMRAKRKAEKEAAKNAD